MSTLGFLDFDWLRPEWWPLALLVPALLALAGLAAATRARRRARLADAALLPLVAGEASHRRGGLRLTFELCAVALAIVALLGPVRGFTERPALRRGLDLAVCVDTSRSMLAQDLNPSRLDRARREVRGLLDQLAGDRVALLAFSGDAREVAPLTRDVRTLSALLDLFDPAENRVGGTDLGAALERALDLFDGRTGAHEAIVVLTDGEDLTGSGLAVARRAAEAGIKVFVVGIGTEGGGKIPVTTADGRTSFLRGPDGEEVVTRLDRASLAAIADATGGAFLTTSDSATPLEELYHKRIGRMDRRELEGGMERIPHDRYQWALVPAVVLWLLAGSLGERRRFGRGAWARAERVTRLGAPAALALAVVSLAAPTARAEDAPPRHPLVVVLQEAVDAAEDGEHLVALRVLDKALGEDEPEGAILDPADQVPTGAPVDVTEDASTSDTPDDRAVELDADAPPTWEPRHRAYLRHARGEVNRRAGYRALAESDFEAAAAGFGPGEERLASMAARFVTRLEAAEERRAELMAPPAQPAPGAPPSATPEQPEDPLAELRALYRRARAAGLERLELDWRDPDTRANLELITRRLRELDRIEEQQQEQEQEQEESDEGEESDEPQEGDEEQEEQDEGDQDQEQPQDQEDPQEPGDESEPEEREPEPQQPEEPAEPEEQDEQPSQPEELEPLGPPPELSKEELQRLMQRLEELEDAQEALQRRIQGGQSAPVERDW